MFIPQPEKSLGYCFHPWCPAGRAFGRSGIRLVSLAAGISCPGCISETIRGMVLILGRDIG